MDKQSFSRTKVLLSLILVVSIAATALLWMDRDGAEELTEPLYGAQSGIERLNADGLQAVFLTNGQVYFGDIAAIDPMSLTLTNVFYLQEQQELQASEEAAPSEGAPTFSLAKLGKTELHGPEDVMVINFEHVLFWENLKSDSQVVKAIQEYQQ